MKNIFGSYLGFIITNNMKWLSHFLLLMRTFNDKISIYTVRLLRIFTFVYSNSKSDNCRYHGFEFMIYKLGIRFVFTRYYHEGRLIRLQEGGYIYGTIPKNGYDA